MLACAVVMPITLLLFCARDTSRYLTAVGLLRMRRAMAELVAVLVLWSPAFTPGAIPEFELLHDSGLALPAGVWAGHLSPLT